MVWSTDCLIGMLVDTTMLHISLISFPLLLCIMVQRWTLVLYLINELSIIDFMAL